MTQARTATSPYLNRPLRSLDAASPFEAVDAATGLVVASSPAIGLAIAAGRRAVPDGAIEIRRRGVVLATIGLASTKRGPALVEGPDPRALICSGVSP